MASPFEVSPRPLAFPVQPCIHASVTSVLKQLAAVHRDLDACRACPKMVGPVVHGHAIDTRVMLIGQAPGPHEGKIGRPFAWTAGKTLFRWLERALGADEETCRSAIYISAVARCFPGKANGGGDRRPDGDEISRCRSFLEREAHILKPRVLLPVGTMAIEQVMGPFDGLASLVGTQRKVTYHGVESDVICLPHPSGASTWHKREPGIALLERALALVGAHPEIKRALAEARGRRATLA